MQDKDFHALAAAIAKALGGAITRRSEPGEWLYADFSTAAGVPLDVRTENNAQGRLRFCVALPRVEHGACRYSASDLLTSEERRSGNAPESSIGVSSDKGAERIAADITRRLIPGAAEMYRRACERRDADNKFHADKAATIARLCKAFNCDARGETVYAPGEHMRVNSGNSVRFEYMSVTPETAIKIQRLLIADKASEVREAAPDKYAPKAPQEINEARFWDALEVLPPCEWQGVGTLVETFYVSERLTANIVSWFVRIGERYFQVDQDADTPRAEIVRMVRQHIEDSRH